MLKCETLDLRVARQAFKAKSILIQVTNLPHTTIITLMCEVMTKPQSDRQQHKGAFSGVHQVYDNKSIYIIFQRVEQ